MVRIILLLLSTMLFFPLPAATPAELLRVINQNREQEGTPPLLEDPVLNRTAAFYSQKLARQGKLSHKDNFGNTVLQRYRDQGGTTVLVGEILGAGTIYAEVVTAWLESSSHRKVLLGLHWTDGGAGSYNQGKTTIYVVLFTERKIRSLELLEDRLQWVLQGRLINPAKGPPVIRTFSITRPPEKWNQQTGAFVFTFPQEDIPLLLRLGYLDTNKKFVLCDVIYPGLTHSEKKEKTIFYDPGINPVQFLP